jgi:hypothetical protein
MTPQRHFGDQAIASSVVLANSNALSFSVGAIQSFVFTAKIYFNLAGILSGYKFALVSPASPANLIYSIRITNLITGALVNAGAFTASGGTLSGALASAGTHLCEIHGAIDNGASGGNVTVQFAQNTSDAGAITLKNGSFMNVQQV